VLVLEGNRLTGALPPHMPPRMAYIDLHDNKLTGTIPAWQWNRDAERIHVVFLHMNKLSGTVPYALTKNTVRDCVGSHYDTISNPSILTGTFDDQRRLGTFWATHPVAHVRERASVAAALSAREPSSPQLTPFLQQRRFVHEPPAQRV